MSAAGRPRRPCGGDRKRELRRVAGQNHCMVYKNVFPDAAPIQLEISKKVCYTGAKRL